MGGVDKDQKAGTTIWELDDLLEWALCNAVEESREREVRAQVGDVDSTPARAGLAYEVVGSDTRGSTELLGVSDNTGDNMGLLIGWGVAFGDRGGGGCGKLIPSGRLLAGKDGPWARRGCNSKGVR